jgi:hypothetical protein
MIAKRTRGRPSFTGKPVKRYQITIPPATANRLRYLGKGSLSAGVIVAEQQTQVVRAGIVFTGDLK